MASRENANPSARRADARRNIERILDAALEVLTEDPDASMARVAEQAGVVRATLYVHFPTRESLIGAVSERAIAEGTEALREAAPERGRPTEALVRMLHAGWQILGRYHALVTLNTRLGPEHMRMIHGPVLEQIRLLLERGQTSGEFNRDLPLDWMLTAVLDLIHAASREVSAGRLSHDDAERVLITTVSGALSSATITSLAEKAEGTEDQR